MGQIKTSNTIPDDSLLERRDYDYLDCFTATVSDPEEKLTPTDVCRVFIKSAPQFVETLMGLRNKIVKVAGLKTGEGHPSTKTEAIEQFSGEVGDYLGPFKVYEHNDDEIILGEDDKHLDFRLSLLITPDKSNQQKLSMTTAVTYNNWMGPTYFTVVKPFHKVIAKSMLKGIVKEINSV